MSRSLLIAMTLTAFGLTSALAADAPTPTVGVSKFLSVLNSGGGKPIEQLSPQAARQVLIDAQKEPGFPPLISLKRQLPWRVSR